MSGIFPRHGAGGQPVRDSDGNPIEQELVENAYIPPAEFDVSCSVNYLPSDCTARFEPRHANALQSEILAIGVRFDPAGWWDCTSPSNLPRLFNNWLASDDFYDSISLSVCSRAGTHVKNADQARFLRVLQCSADGIKASEFGQLTDVILCGYTTQDDLDYDLAAISCGGDSPVKVTFEVVYNAFYTRMGIEQINDVISNSPYFAYYANPEKSKSLNINENISKSIIAGNRWPTTAEDEYVNSYTGGNPSGDLPNYAGTDLASCLIMPPAEDQTNYVAPSVPWMNFGGGNRRIIPVDVRTVLFNQMESIPIFEPVDVNGFGYLTWRCISEYPIHTIIEGSMDVMVQTGLTQDETLSRHILRIVADPFTLPKLELGQNNGIQSLAASLSVIQQPQRFRDIREFNDPGGYTDQFVKDNMELNPTNYFTTSERGFFNSSDSTEELRTADDQGEVGDEVRTTDWIDVSGMDYEHRSLAIDFNGKSFRGRVQVKRADGSIYYLNSGSWDADARRVYRIPNDAAFMRFYYTGRGATVDDSSMRICLLGQNTSAERDPLKGFWEHRTFNIKRDVTFWPNGVYALELLTLLASDVGTGRDYGFRFQGGGLSFLFDAGRMRKKLFNMKFQRS